MNDTQLENLKIAEFAIVVVILVILLWWSFKALKLRTSILGMFHANEGDNTSNSDNNPA